MALHKAVWGTGFLGRILSRTIQTSATRLGPDSRSKRSGHLELTDRVEGEGYSVASPQESYELVDENLMDRVINNMKFKDIPIIYIKSTRNNTKITLRRGDSTRIAHKSGGTEGYKNCRKGTTVAAQAVANRILTIAQDNEITMARMVFDGLGPGRNAAFKVFEMSKFNIVSLTDRTQAAEPWNLRPRARRSI